MQSSSQIVTTNKPTSTFLLAGCPSCRQCQSTKAVIQTQNSDKKQKKNLFSVGKLDMTLPIGARSQDNLRKKQFFGIKYQRIG